MVIDNREDSAFSLKVPYSNSVMNDRIIFVTCSADVHRC